MIKNIVIVGVDGSGINFLKNIFLLSSKLSLKTPNCDPVPADKYEFICDYYKNLKNKLNQGGDWLEHEWLLRLSWHWTDNFNSNSEIIKVDITNPTVFVAHTENFILVDDPIDLVHVVIDDWHLCEKLYQHKSKNHKFKMFSDKVLNEVPHPNRTYHTILFSELFNSPRKISNLADKLQLEIKSSYIESIHYIWSQCNKLVLEDKTFKKNT